MLYITTTTTTIAAAAVRAFTRCSAVDSATELEQKCQLFKVLLSKKPPTTTRFGCQIMQNRLQQASEIQRTHTHARMRALTYLGAACQLVRAGKDAQRLPSSEDEANSGKLR